MGWGGEDGGGAGGGSWGRLERVGKEGVVETSYDDGRVMWKGRKTRG